MTTRRYNTKSGPRWSVEFERDGTRVRKKGFLSRELAEEFALDRRIRIQRGTLQLYKASRKARVQPLIDAWIAACEGQGITAKLCLTYSYRLEKLAAECGWLTAGDITADSFIRWRDSRPSWRGKPIGGKTLNQYQAMARAWCDWLVQRHTLTANPIAAVKYVKRIPRRQHRRAATLDELNRILAVAPEDRRLAYKFLAYVPLRMRAFRAMTWGWLRLRDTHPTVQVPADADKTGKGYTLPLRHDLAHELRLARGKRGANEAVFAPISVAVWRSDLRRAGVAFCAADGTRRLDLHAFRRTHVELMRQAGVGVDVSHAMLGHADKATTERWYQESEAAETLRGGVDALPELGRMKIEGTK